MQKDLWLEYNEIGLEDSWVAKGKGPLLWNWGVPYVKLVQKNHELI